MSVKHVGSLPEFNQILRAAGAKLVVVDFHATWCGPCHAIAPHYERLARQYTGRAIFLKVDVDAAEDVAQHFNISAMPTFHFHLRSRLVAQISGADPAELDSNVARYAPDTADVSFSGEGQRLTSDSPTTPTSTIQSARESAAAAAARRMENARAAAAAARAAELQSSASSPRPSASASASASNALRPQSFSPPPSNGNDARLKVNETLLRQMVEEMGFPRVRAEKALILTGNRGLESAVEWCFEHAEDADIDEPLQVVTKDGASKPRLSPEEAKRRADELTARARVRREADEKKEAIERERSRLRSGKEISAARVKLEEEERKRAVEEKRRIKREALAERQRVREMLEADKQRRHERFNMGGARPTPQPAPVPLPRQTMPSASAAAGMIQFRMPDGSRIEGEFEAGNTIADLVSFLVGKRPELSTRMITLSQQYPRKSYSQGDYNLLLGDLKLLPRGALAVSFS